MTTHLGRFGIELLLGFDERGNVANWLGVVQDCAAQVDGFFSRVDEFLFRRLDCVTTCQNWYELVSCVAPVNPSSRPPRSAI